MDSKKDKEVLSEAARSRYGTIASCVGIAMNILLFCIKLFAGLISGAVSIVADAFNNLSDSASSLITLLGFRLAAKKPDRDHPFGHGRFEYISGFIVSIMIILVGFELAKSSVEKIITPEAVEFSGLAVAILCISVAVKLAMAIYYRSVGRRIGSGAVMASATDCLSDSVATTVVLACMLIGHFTSVNIDAYCGLAVSVFILISGLRSANETLSPLLGQPPTEEFLQRIDSIVRECELVKGTHDIIVHDYGPGRLIVSLHAEVPCDIDLLLIHDAIDNAEKELGERLGCEAVIHMDPVQVNDERVTEARKMVESLVTQIDARITVHDFRMVEGPTHTNLIFDAVLPRELKISDSEARDRISALISENDPCYRTVIQIDRSYIF